MKCALLLLLVVVFAVNYEAEAGWFRRIRWRRVARIAGTAWKYYKIYQTFGGKRAIMEIDTNKNGYVDQSELEDILHSRDARDLLEMADEDGDSKVSMEEFQNLMDEMSKLDQRE